MSILDPCESDHTTSHGLSDARRRARATLAGHGPARRLPGEVEADRFTRVARPGTSTGPRARRGRRGAGDGAGRPRPWRASVPRRPIPRASRPPRRRRWRRRPGTLAGECAASSDPACVAAAAAPAMAPAARDPGGRACRVVRSRVRRGRRGAGDGAGGPGPWRASVPHRPIPRAAPASTPTRGRVRPPGVAVPVPRLLPLPRPVRSRPDPDAPSDPDRRPNAVRPRRPPFGAHRPPRGRRLPPPRTALTCTSTPWTRPRSRVPGRSWSSATRTLQAEGLDLDLTRGKPAGDQLALSAALDGALDGGYRAEDGADAPRLRRERRHRGGAAPRRAVARARPGGGPGRRQQQPHVHVPVPARRPPFRPGRTGERLGRRTRGRAASSVPCPATTGTSPSAGTSASRWSRCR